MDMAAILVMWLGPFDQTFVPNHEEAPVVIEEKKFKKYWNWKIWTKVSEWPWPSISYRCMYSFS